MWRAEYTKLLEFYNHIKKTISWSYSNPVSKLLEIYDRQESC